MLKWEKEHQKKDNTVQETGMHMYNNFECAFVEEGETTEWFQVQSGVIQGCTMSGFLFLLSIDLVINRTTEGKRTGIQWKLTSVLEYLDFAGDIA